MTLVDLTTFDQTVQIGQEILTIDLASLYRAFEQVKDRRGLRQLVRDRSGKHTDSYSFA